jgi:hypothetical protein
MVEVIRVASSDLLHDQVQLVFGVAKQQMNVVFHQAICHLLKTQLQAVALYRTQEVLVILDIFKQDLPADTPKNDMVIATFALLTRCPSSYLWSYHSKGRIWLSREPSP